ncbi:MULTISPECIES: GntR family transcriptional regulator [Rhizobium]|uniref:GntR family transcriptional regulator n=1 Tax=Rhizobium TaxID=379 RepID=UPI001956CC88|nr:MULTISPECIES: GntR family transcriptional regulator [Rhizobium]MBM7044787.1 GntR family transcriptional regulator [Rhizobium lusitanum]
MTISIEELFVSLDRSGPIPMYYQIAKRMREAIESGDLPAGSRIDNEVKLADHLGISRPTIRRAIHELVNQGLLVRRRGIGTQVVRGHLTRNFEISSLYDDLKFKNRAPTTKILLREEVVPPADILDALTLPEGTKVLHLRRLRYTDGIPFALLEDFLPPEFLTISADALEKHGLYQLMRSRGTTLRVARQTVGARASTKEEAKLFEQKPKMPVLTMARTVFDQSGHAVDYGTHAYRPDLYSFEMTLVEK